MVKCVRAEPWESLKKNGVYTMLHELCIRLFLLNVSLRAVIITRMFRSIQFNFILTFKPLCAAAPRPDEQGKENRIRFKPIVVRGY